MYVNSLIKECHFHVINNNIIHIFFSNIFGSKEKPFKKYCCDGKYNAFKPIDSQVSDKYKQTRNNNSISQSSYTLESRQYNLK